MSEGYTLDRCRVCEGRQLRPVLDLGDQPWCNNFLKPDELGKEPLYPLRLVYCSGCSAAQLDYTVPKEVMFADHTYLSGITRSLDEHFKSVAGEVDREFFRQEKEKSVLDIGSNDGTQLRHYRDLGYEVLGVEPAMTPCSIAVDKGIPTINAFFNLELSRKLARKFHVVNASGVLFHLEELHSVIEGIRLALRPDGVLVAQFIYMKAVMANCAFDQIYHEHLLYYTLWTINRLLRLHGLELFDAYISPIHGGSVIGFITHAARRPVTGRLMRLFREEEASGANDFGGYSEFSSRVAGMKDKNIAYLQAARKNKKKVFGFGAPAKGNTLLNYFGIGSAHICCLVEKNRLRKGLYSPGAHIPVVMEEELADTPDIYYVLAWNFKDEILSNNKHLLEKGVEFYFPVNPQT